MKHNEEPAVMALPCGCTLEARCQAASQMHRAFVQARQQGARVAWRAGIVQYTAHVAALSPHWAPGTESWPMGEGWETEG